MDVLQFLTNIGLILCIALLNGFFTASGFALVRVRTTQIEELVVKGHFRARVAKSVLANLDRYLSATQFGNVMTSLGMGWLGEPFIARLLSGFLEDLGITNPQAIQAVSFSVAFGLITFLNIIFGELVPKSMAIQKAKAISLWVAYPLKLFLFVFHPVIRILDFVATLILRILGISVTSQPEALHSTEEIRLLLSQERGVSHLGKNLVLGAVDFRQKQARHVMVPRPEIVALNLNAQVHENVEVMRTNKYSRYPAYNDTIDNIVGVVHTKDIFKTELNHQPDFRLESVIRDAVFLPETVLLEKALEVMLTKKVHMIILVDEFGGTAGLITLENVLEEIVGTIQDEFDRETPEVTKISDDEYLVDAAMITNDIERLMNRELSPKDILSIGGFLMEQFGHIPESGETVEVNGIRFTVEQVTDRAIETVRVKRLTDLPGEQKE